MEIEQIKQQLNSEFNQFATDMKLSEYQLSAFNLLFSKTIKIIEAEIKIDE